MSIYSTTITATSCKFADVKRAYNNTKVGDTLKIPAGSAFWDSTLVVKHGLILLGPGADKTTITNSQLNKNIWNYVFVYDPDLISVTSNSKFDVSGLRFQTNGQSNNAIISITVGETDPLVDRIRIHHCTFDGGNNELSYIWKAIEFDGGACGLIDNNRFINVKKAVNSYGSNEKTWNAFYPAPIGSSQNVYVESNLIENTINDGSLCCSGVMSSGQGGRIAIRYNQWKGIYGYSLFDAHGNQPSGVVGSLLFEAYGNRFDFNESHKMMDLRGGVGLIFYNYGVSQGNSQSITIRDEHDDNILPNVTGIEHVNESYFWKNICNSVDIVPKNDIDVNNSIDEDVEWWNYNKSFDGTSGIGCGPLSNRPKTCTKGVGYWATEQSNIITEENCGINPKKPIKGVLYRCTSANVWQKYYTTFTYPHPLTYEPCNIDSVVMRDTVKIYGRRFLSSPGDSGYVKINNSMVTIDKWTDTLISIPYTGFVSRVDIRNAGKFTDNYGNATDNESYMGYFIMSAGLPINNSAGMSTYYK